MFRFDLHNASQSKFSDEIDSVVDEIAAKVRIAWLALFVTIKFVESKFRVCTNASIVSCMVLSFVVSTTTNTRFFCIAQPYVLVENSLRFSKPFRSRLNFQLGFPDALTYFLFLFGFFLFFKSFCQLITTNRAAPFLKRSVRCK